MKKLVLGAVLLVGGVIMLIVGIAMKSHYAPLVRECSGFTGRVAQFFSGTVVIDCSTAGTMSHVAVALMVCGAIGAVGGIGMFIARAVGNPAPNAAVRRGG